MACTKGILGISPCNDYPPLFTMNAQINLTMNFNDYVYICATMSGTPCFLGFDGEPPYSDGQTLYFYPGCSLTSVSAQPAKWIVGPIPTSTANPTLNYIPCGTGPVPVYSSSTQTTGASCSGVALSQQVFFYNTQYDNFITIQQSDSQWKIMQRSNSFNTFGLCNGSSLFTINGTGNYVQYGESNIYNIYCPGKDAGLTNNSSPADCQFKCYPTTTQSGYDKLNCFFVPVLDDSITTLQCCNGNSIYPTGYCGTYDPPLTGGMQNSCSTFLTNYCGLVGQADVNCGCNLPPYYYSLFNSINNANAVVCAYGPCVQEGAYMTQAQITSKVCDGVYCEIIESGLSNNPNVKIVNNQNCGDNNPWKSLSKTKKILLISIVCLFLFIIFVIIIVLLL